MSRGKVSNMIFSSFLFGKLSDVVAVPVSELPSTGKYLRHEIYQFYLCE